MLELRNAILSADTTGQTTFASVKLGPRYPSRIFAVNPPPPGGTLATGPPQNITVTDDTGATVSNLCPAGNQVQTRTLQYTPGYNEYQDAPTIVYENTVLYMNFSGETVLLSDETLVQGSTVNVKPLNTSLRESGLRRVSVEPKPGRTETRNVDGAQVTYPTGLSQATWRELLAEDLDPSQVTVTDGELTINTSGRVAVSCAPVGLNEVPPGGPRAGSGVDINPVGPNDIELRSVDRTSNDVVEATFNNTGENTANITEARLTFYNNPSDTGGDVGPIELRQDGVVTATLDVSGPTVRTDPEVTLAGNGTETTLRFDNTGGEKFAQDDFFVVDFTFSNGEAGTYFVDVPQ